MQVRSKIARGACNQPKAGCMGPVVCFSLIAMVKILPDKLQVWDDELARVAQKWADQCADVDYKDDYKRKDPHLFHDPHPQRKVGRNHKTYKANIYMPSNQLFSGFQ